MGKRGKTKSEPGVLLLADSENSADMLYFGGVFVPDPFIAMEVRGEKICVVSQLEFERVRREGSFDTVLLLEDEFKEAEKTIKKAKHVHTAVILNLAKKYRLKHYTIPQDFPAGPAFALKAGGLKLEVKDGLIFESREYKNDNEAKKIREGNAASAAGFKVVETILKASKVGRSGYLMYKGKRLTSEKLQQAIAVACLELGAIAANTIVAGGDQACDPHCRGSGPLKANELIIVDIFPRIAKTGYHGDMTRTYLKGKASDEQRKLYNTVFEAEQFAIGEHRARKSGKKIYAEVMKRFETAGYRTERQDGVPVGFFHGLGHGLGLAVHEPPRVNKSGGILRSGQVITVEPGLYYPGLGGVRVEDVVRINSGKPELLSDWGYNWEIR